MNLICFDLFNSIFVWVASFSNCLNFLSFTTCFRSFAEALSLVYTCNEYQSSAPYRKSHRVLRLSDLISDKIKMPSAASHTASTGPPAQDLSWHLAAPYSHLYKERPASLPSTFESEMVFDSCESMDGEESDSDWEGVDDIVIQYNPI